MNTSETLRSTLNMEVSSTQITIQEQIKTPLNSTFDEYNFLLSCSPSLSGYPTITINVVSDGCTELKFSWTKACNTDSPIAKRGFAVTHLKDDNRFIVKDGMVIEKNYMQLVTKDKKSIGEYHSQIKMYLHLLPVNKKYPNNDITLSTSKAIQKLPNYKELVHLTNCNNSMIQNL